MKQFLAAGADNVIQKPAKTDTLVDILLTGLEMMVVFDETQQQRRPTPISSINYLRDRDSHVRDIEMVRQEHMEHLFKFLADTKIKAEIKARELRAAALLPVVIVHVPVVVPVLLPLVVPSPSP